MTYLRIFACLCVFLKVFGFITCYEESQCEENYLKLHQQIVESANAKLLLNIDESNFRIKNMIDSVINDFGELKQLLGDHIKSTTDDNNAILQDITFLKLRMNEFKISALENSLATIEKNHFLHENSLNEVKSLINDNRNIATNESRILGKVLKKQNDELNEVKQLVGRVKVLTTAEISNCADVSDNEATGNNNSNIYNLYLPMSGLERFKVYCLPDKQNGSTWTIIQRRQDNSTNFFRGWEEYKLGFGDPSGNYWIGLEKLHKLTSAQPYELWIQLEDFEGNTRSANYSAFGIGDEESKYALTILGSYNGNAGGDSLGGHKGQKFSTHDSDNDAVDGNCAVNFKGAWWYKNCHNSNLNGEYLYGETQIQGQGLIWYFWLGNKYSLKYVHMAIRPLHLNLTTDDIK